MPYDYHWQDEDHTIIRIDMYGKVTWEEWYAVIDQVVAEIAASSHRVDLIFNDKAGMPPGNPMPHMRASMSKLNAQPNTGMAVTVSTPRYSSIVRTIVNIILRISRGMGMQMQSGNFVGTMEEALKLIEAERAKQASAVR